MVWCVVIDGLVLQVTVKSLRRRQEESNNRREQRELQRRSKKKVSLSANLFIVIFFFGGGGLNEHGVGLTLLAAGGAGSPFRI